MTNTKKITLSALFMSFYIVIMYFTQSFAFGQYQIRIATALYAFAALYPFLILPMALGNMLSNMLMGGFGVFDILGGLIVGLVTGTVVYLIKKFKLSDWFIIFPIILAPAVIVPIWLSIMIKVPYNALALSIGIGQIIPGIVGAILVKQLRGKI